MMFGMALMLLVIILPILAVGLLLGMGVIYLQNRGGSASGVTTLIPGIPPAAQSNSPATSPTHYCSHCAYGLHSDWTHCPQCGAPV